MSVCHHVCLHICYFSMDMKLEHRANIKFCMKLGKSGTETFEMIRRAYRNGESCEVFRVARALQERQNITRRRREVRVNFHELNTQKCGNISAACA